MRFVNLRKNVDHPMDAFAVGRALLSLAQSKNTTDTVEIITGSEFWGEVILESQGCYTDGSRWTANAYTQHGLHQIAKTLVRNSLLCAPDAPKLHIPITKLSTVAKLGPYHLQIKGQRGAYRIIETDDSTRSGRPAIWHHNSNRVATMEGRPDSVLQILDGRAIEADRLWEQRSRLHITEELRHAPQRVAAVWCKQPMLGVRSWKSLTLHSEDGQTDEIQIQRERALVLWFNTTLGLLTRIPYANRPYLGRTGLPSDVLVDLPVLDVTQLPAGGLKATRSVWDDLSKLELMGFADTPTDEVRKQLNRRFIIDVLGGTDKTAEALDRIAEQLSAEPVVYVRA